MTILIIITAYIANVFLNRWLNKILCKIDFRYQPMIMLWFVPLIVTFIFLISIIDKLRFFDWFKGENWFK